jgi:hypothetical protein
MARNVVAEIQRATRRKFRDDEKIRVVLEARTRCMTTRKPVDRDASWAEIPGPPKGPLFGTNVCISGHETTGIDRDITQPIDLTRWAARLSRRRREDLKPPPYGDHLVNVS